MHNNSLLHTVRLVVSTNIQNWQKYSLFLRKDDISNVLLKNILKTYIIIGC
jgi:hypothetical protein